MALLPLVLLLTPLLLELPLLALLLPLLLLLLTLLPLLLLLTPLLLELPLLALLLPLLLLLLALLLTPTFSPAASAQPRIGRFLSLCDHLRLPSQVAEGLVGTLMGRHGSGEHDRPVSRRGAGRPCGDGHSRAGHEQTGQTLQFHRSISVYRSLRADRSPEFSRAHRRRDHRAAVLGVNDST